MQTLQTVNTGAAVLMANAIGYRDRTFGELRDMGVRPVVRCIPCRRRSYPDCTNADLAERTPGSARFACAKCGTAGLVLFVPPKTRRVSQRPRQASEAPSALSFHRGPNLPPERRHPRVRVST
jgi:hypothetical protein